MTEQYYEAAKWLAEQPEWKKKVIDEYWLVSKHSKSVEEIEEWLEKREGKG